MAFTPEQKISICMILGVNSMELDARLSYYEPEITTAVETQVIAEIARWTTAGAKFVKVKPFGQNEGTDFDPESEKRDIRNNIGLLLYCSDLIGSSTGGSLDSFTIQRG